MSYPDSAHWSDPPGDGEEPDGFPLPPRARRSRSRRAAPERALPDAVPGYDERAGDVRPLWPTGADQAGPEGHLGPEAGYPGPGAGPAEPGTNGRAGRNLPAAIAVGVSLGGVVLASLFLWKPAFLGVCVVAIAVATWEMARAVRATGASSPRTPLLAGGVVMAGLAWFGGAEALTLGLAITAVAVFIWRLSDGPVGYQRDVGAALLIAVYVPFLAGFALLLAAPDDGARRVVAMLVGVVLSDTGGYVAGVFFGRHPMAPTVSPKKSWEGLAGSLVITAAGSSVLLYHLLHVAWWYGAVFGLAVSAAAVLGDLAESLIKRDLGVKDMSRLLPGHGGLMDRLDSVLFAAPTAYAVLALVAPATG